MYPSVRSIPRASGQAAAENGRVMSRNLAALGFTSFFSDISSEMVVAVTPLFLTAGLGFSIGGFALFEVAREAINALSQIWGGSWADQRQQHKRTAATGYAVSTATRLGLVLSALVSAIPAVPFLLADRVGKGIRTSPRDALISLSTPPERLATAFGIHRAMDTAGALLGPLLAFVVLDQAPGAFDAVFVMSAIAGVVGVAVIATFAEERPQRDRTERPPVRDQWRAVLATPGMARLALGAGMLAVFTIGEAFAYLVIQRTTDMAAKWFPLLFVGTALVYLLLAVPVGRLADRIGARTVFLAGHVLLVLLYALLGFTDLAVPVALLCLLAFGAYHAATDGVIAALTAGLVAPTLRASGIAFVTVVMAGARMLSAAIFGLIWHTTGRTEALTVFAIALIGALVAATRLTRGIGTVADTGAPA